MTTQFHRAQQQNNRFRLAISCSDGSGKTHKDLLIGFDLGEALEHSRCQIMVTLCLPKADAPTTANGNPSRPTTQPAPAALPSQPAAAGKKRLF